MVASVCPWSRPGPRICIHNYRVYTIHVGFGTFPVHLVSISITCISHLYLNAFMFKYYLHCVLRYDNVFNNLFCTIVSICKLYCLYFKDEGSVNCDAGLSCAFGTNSWQLLKERLCFCNLVIFFIIRIFESDVFRYLSFHVTGDTMTYIPVPEAASTSWGRIMVHFDLISLGLTLCCIEFHTYYHSDHRNWTSKLF